KIVFMTRINDYRFYLRDPRSGILGSRVGPEKSREDTHVEREQVLRGGLSPTRHAYRPAQRVEDLLDAQLNAAGDLVLRPTRPPWARLYLAVLVAREVGGRGVRTPL